MQEWVRLKKYLPKGDFSLLGVENAETCWKFLLIQPNWVLFVLASLTLKELPVDEILSWPGYRAFPLVCSLNLGQEEHYCVVSVPPWTQRANVRSVRVCVSEWVCTTVFVNVRSNGNRRSWFCHDFPSTLWISFVQPSWAPTSCFHLMTFKARLHPNPLFLMIHWVRDSKYTHSGWRHKPEWSTNNARACQP